MGSRRLSFRPIVAKAPRIRFRLTSVNGPLTGTILHNGEALTGTAQFSDGIAQVILPAHSREGATHPSSADLGQWSPNGNNPPQRRGPHRYRPVQRWDRAGYPSGP